MNGPNSESLPTADALITPGQERELRDLTDSTVLLGDALQLARRGGKKLVGKTFSGQLRRQQL